MWFTTFIVLQENKRICSFTNNMKYEFTIVLNDNPNYVEKGQFLYDFLSLYINNESLLLLNIDEINNEDIHTRYFFYVCQIN